MEANLFAPLALLVWPAICLKIYINTPSNKATFWTILGGLLLLPVGYNFDFPLIPPLDKNSIPCLTTLLGCLWIAKPQIQLWSRHKFGLIEFLLAAVIFIPFVTSELNQDPIIYQAIQLPGLTHYDAISTIIQQVILIIPFILGRRLFRSTAYCEYFLSSITMAMLLYSPLMLLEVRLSPQLHTWIYGYFPHSFLQQIRFDGFRPVVFLGHGLIVAFFTVMSFVSATVLWRSGTKIRIWKAGKITIYLGMLLILCKSFASIAYGMILGSLICWFSPRRQLHAACLMAIIVIGYPLLRMEDMIDTDYLVSVAADIDDKRAESLKYRFDNENLLLQHARERFMFGWGGWSRNRVYNDEGNDISVTDGGWIITLGQFGFLGFIAKFGLLALPVFRASRVLRYCASARERAHLAGLGLLLAISLIDLLPNGFLTPFTWLLAGALLGRTEELALARKKKPLSLAPSLGDGVLHGR
jgi:hypothetical protein